MSIKHLSNTELEQSLKKAVATERKILHLVLEHILEVNNRKMFLEKAYPSLYEYLVKECGYTGSAAMRRISAARLMKDIPEVAFEIKSGNLNLSQIGELSRAIKEKEKSGFKVDLKKKVEILEAISGKTVGSSQVEISRKLDLELKPTERSFVQKDESVHMQIKEQHKLFQICRDLEANALLSEYNDTSFLAVFEFLAKSHLKHLKMDELVWDMEKSKDDELVLSKRNSNLNPRSESNSAEKPRSRMNTASKELIGLEGKKDNSQVNQKPKSETNKSNVISLKTNKTLTPKTKRTMLLKDKCCQFKDPQTGRICGSTFNLNIDHKIPKWADGSHELYNLQVLCQGHNNFKYRKESNRRLF